MKKLLILLLLSTSFSTFADNNLETCLSGKSPLLCDHNRLTSQERSEVKKAEIAENLKICLSGKSPLLCDHNRLTSQERSEVKKAERKIYFLVTESN